jgi:hypothetical protein
VKVGVLTLSRDERELIDWFIFEHLEFDTGPGRDREKWNQSYQSCAKGGRGWWRIQQGHTGILRLLHWYQNIHKPNSKEWRPAIVIGAALAVAKSVKDDYHEYLGIGQE